MFHIMRFQPYNPNIAFCFDAVAENNAAPIDVCVCVFILSHVILLSGRLGFSMFIIFHFIFLFGALNWITCTTVHINSNLL